MHVMVSIHSLLKGSKQFQYESHAQTTKIKADVLYVDEGKHHTSLIICEITITVSKNEINI
jgi:hypothetical protein